MNKLAQTKFAKTVKAAFFRKTAGRAGSFVRKSLLVGGAILMVAALGSCRKTYFDMQVRAPAEGEVVCLPIQNSSLILPGKAEEGVTVICHGEVVMKDINVGSFSYKDRVSDRTIYITRFDYGYSYSIIVSK